ncbi:MAG: ATPase, T2SS/T4P/T4SS family [Kiritimatiellia bacterium]
MTESLQLEIRRPGGESSVFDVEHGVYTVGSDEGCKIRLSHGDIDPRHAVLTLRPDAFWVEDLDAAAGTTIDGTKISGRNEIKSGQKLGIGPFTIVIKTPESAEAPPAEPVQEPSPPQPPPRPEPSPPETKSPSPPPPETELEQRAAVKNQIHRELLKRLDIRRLSAISRIDQDELREKARSAITDIVNEVKNRLPPGLQPGSLIKEIYDEAVGLGPLEEFLADPEVTEIMVNGHSQIYVEKHGKLVMTDKAFMNNSSVLAIIERIVSPLGRRIDESQPYVDARLPDGSRVNAIIHPLSLVGPCLTIRKFSEKPFTEEELIRFGTVTKSILEFLDICVKLRKNIVVSGGTGSGKTTFLNALSNYLPDTDRILTIEDAAELRLTQRHVVSLEAKQPNIEGKGAVTIRDLVRNSLRMRPDRIVVGECRGGEALDMLQAMNTGHDGSLTTVHSNSPRDVISRLETMVLMSGMELPVRAIREQIAAAIDIIAHESRFSDGTRKIVTISEVVGLEGQQITMQDIFSYTQTGIDEEGRVEGSFKPTGAVPTFIDEVKSRGLSIHRAMFDPQQWKE